MNGDRASWPAARGVGRVAGPHVRAPRARWAMAGGDDVRPQASASTTSTSSPTCTARLPIAHVTHQNGDRPSLKLTSRAPVVKHDSIWTVELAGNICELPSSSSCWDGIPVGVTGNPSRTESGASRAPRTSPRDGGPRDRSRHREPEPSSSRTARPGVHRSAVLAISEVSRAPSWHSGSSNGSVFNPGRIRRGSGRCLATLRAWQPNLSS